MPGRPGASARAPKTSRADELAGGAGLRSVHTAVMPGLSGIGMLAAILSIALGICGWLIAKLLFEPAKEIIDLRRQAQECLIVYGNLKPNALDEERLMAAEAFRHAGAALISHALAAYPWVRWFFSKALKIDIHSAGDFLLGMAHDTQFEGLSHAAISPIVTHIQQCLNLPKIEMSPMMRMLMENAAKGSPSEFD